jgi:hypothetical protein
MSNCCAKLGADPTKQGNLMELRSTVTCPHCGHQETETMPIDACQFFYDCKGCGVVLRPNDGDCCVFCSYGSVPCPPMQEARETGSAGNCCGRPIVG